MRTGIRDQTSAKKSVIGTEAAPAAFVGWRGHEQGGVDRNGSQAGEDVAVAERKKAHCLACGLQLRCHEERLDAAARVGKVGAGVEVRDEYAGKGHRAEGIPGTHHRVGQEERLSGAGDHQGAPVRRQNGGERGGVNAARRHC